MKKVVCVVDNHIHLQYGKTYEVVSEFAGEYKLSRDHYESDIAGIYWWDKKLFVSLEEFRKEQIEKILE
jgi:hypothetical protein